MAYTIAEIAKALGLTPVGDTSLKVQGVAEPALAGPDELALAMKPDYAARLGEGAAQAAMLWHDADWESYGLKAAILSPRPRYALADLSHMMDPGPGYGAGVHPSAVVDPSAELGEGVSVGPLAVIDAGAKIGAGSVIGPQVHIGAEVTIGEGGMVHAGARIGARVTIGKRFICQPGAVIGGDGFSFVTPEASDVEVARKDISGETARSSQQWARIYSLGAVTIGDDCEVGANACIDRGTIRDTVIGDGTKVDNLVQVGHNCVIGKDCLLCGCVGLAGSITIGNSVVLAGQVGVSDNITIGDNVIAGGASVILSNVPAGRAVLGYPAMKMDAHVESYKGIRRLPRLFREVAELKKAVSKLTGND